MELEIGDYVIPDGCSIMRSGRTLLVYETKSNKLKEGDYRCKDCIHYIKGYSPNSGWFETTVCRMFPKRMSKDGKRMLYKAAYKYGKPCDSFKMREEEV